MTTVATPTARVAVVGRESVGKSQLVSSLTRSEATESNFGGSTVVVESYEADGRTFVDTPGILRRSDTETTRAALEELDRHDTVLLVVQATQLDDELAEMLPLVEGKRGAAVLTFWDKVQQGEAALEAVEKLTRATGVPLVPVDARSLTDDDREAIVAALDRPGRFSDSTGGVRAGWRIEPRPGWLEHRFLGPVLAIALLLLPTLATIFGANAFADRLHPIVDAGVQPLIALIERSWPWWATIVLTAESSGFGYGLLNMGPFLLVWALPTVLLFSLILGAYKASGLIERINVALDPLVRPLGLSGRDVVRVTMGFGCNVPAVVATRACSSCSRGPAISAIAFGAACSYQLPATMAVLTAAAGSSWQASGLILGFLAYLLVTTLIYVRLTSPAAARNPLNVLMLPRRPFMQWPTPSALWREARGTVEQFLFQALPVFAVICIIASLLASTGLLELVAGAVAPLMAVFNLPPEATLPIVLASVRKDGIFLFAGDNGLAFPMTSVQVLTAVYLAGVLLPCLVTTLTIARETSVRSAAGLLVRQSGFAAAAAILLAQVGAIL